MVKQKLFLIGSFLLFIISVCTVNGFASPKQLAGPPSEFKNHELPIPNAGSVVQESALLNIKLNPSLSHGLGKLESFHELHVDSDTAFSFTIFSPHEKILKLVLFNPVGEKVDLSNKGTKDFFPIGGDRVEGTTYDFVKPIKGNWKLHIVTDSISAEHRQLLLKSPKKHGVVLLWNESPLRIYTRLNTYQLKLSNDIGLVTMVTNNAMISRLSDPEPLSDSIFDAQMDIKLPNGSDIDVKMHDDGLHDDLGSNDGVYAAWLPADQPGIYHAQAVIKGKDKQGKDFIRTSEHIIAVVDEEIHFSGNAQGSNKDDERMTIKIGLDVDQLPNPSKVFRGYAEVYGIDANGQEKPACWISSLNIVEDNSFTLELNIKWLKMAGVQGPITLKNVYLQDSGTYVPVAQIEKILVTVTYNLNEKLNAVEKVSIATKEMRHGVRPNFAKKNITAGSRKLLLTHGYCASDNPWEKYPEDWTDAIYFSNPNQNINNQEFAQRLYEFVEKSDLSSFGVVGHSQGGLASLTLLNYFHTSMDEAEGERLIQSVGSPYQGSSGAGTAASLASVFGVGCGSNFDLSIDGAALWLAGITQESQSKVYFYTTTFDADRDGFFGDYCSRVTNTVLEAPNDGATELVRATLPYGNNMGNTEEWCHTDGMKYEAQYWDRNRNKIMNQMASR